MLAEWQVLTWKPNEERKKHMTRPHGKDKENRNE